MRFYIEGPCYVEVDGAILIEPASDSHTPPAQSAEPDLVAQARAIFADGGEATYTPPGRKRRHPHRRICQYCGVLFMGRSNQLFCQSSHKAASYRERSDAGLPSRAGAGR